MKIDQYPLQKFSSREGTETDLVILHYTAGHGEPMATAKVFEVPGRKASAHYIVGRDGTVLQCVKHAFAAWHAGDNGMSRFPFADDIEGAELTEDGHGLVPLLEVPPMPRTVNRRSIGIEICNRGWAPHNGRPSVEARHRNPASKARTWEAYPLAQQLAVRELCAELVQQIPTLRYICGHEDVTNKYTLGQPGAKLDPGPAWPWPPIPGLLRVWFDFKKKGWAF